MNRTVITALGVAALTLLWQAAALGADKEKTITGEGQCVKCALHEGKTCQNAVTVEENGKKVTYYLTQNKVSKDFHEHLCKSAAKVKVTGTVKDAHGKLELTPTKIELVKG